MTTYRISPTVLKRAMRVGIPAIGAEERVLQMARLAARFTHPAANRRFRDYIMWIEDDGEVTMIDVMAAEEAAYYNARTHRERRAETDKPLRERNAHRRSVNGCEFSWLGGLRFSRQDKIVAVDHGGSRGVRPDRDLRCQSSCFLAIWEEDG